LEEQAKFEVNSSLEDAMQQFAPSSYSSSLKVKQDLDELMKRQKEQLNKDKEKL